MLTFLFWNVNKKRLDGHIARLAQEHSVDVLLLIEHPKPDHVLLSSLNGIRPFHRVPTHQRFSVYTSFDPGKMERIQPRPPRPGIVWIIGM